MRQFKTMNLVYGMVFNINDVYIILESIEKTEKYTGKLSESSWTENNKYENLTLYVNWRKYELN